MTTDAPRALRLRRATPTAVRSLHPYYTTRSGRFDTASRRVLDFKDGRAEAAAYYLEAMDAAVPGGVAVAAVPPHAPGSGGGVSPVVGLARALARRSGRSDASGALVRRRAVQKLSRGGRRDVGVHLDSVWVPRPGLVAGRRVALIDDVATTGNSLAACRQLLLDAGAAAVELFVIAKTTY